MDCWSGEGPHSPFVSRCRRTMSTQMAVVVRYGGCAPLPRYITASVGPAKVACPFRQVSSVFLAEACAEINIHARIVARPGCPPTYLSYIPHFLSLPRLPDASPSSVSQVFAYAAHATLEARCDPSAKFTDTQRGDDPAISPLSGICMQTGRVLSLPGEVTASAWRC